MIFRINYEELRALQDGVELVVDPTSGGTEGSVAIAPSTLVLELERLRKRLDGDLSIMTLADQSRVQRAVTAVCDRLKDELDMLVTEFHPGHEYAVNAYFAYGHARAVLDRLQEMGDEMRAMIEVMTGSPPDAGTRRSVQFPD